MENKNILILKKHPLYDLNKDNAFFKNQLGYDGDDVLFFDVTSHAIKNKELMKDHPTFVYDCSPFYLGPVETSDGFSVPIFEHYYQCSKVYPCHIKDGEITPEYFEWRNKWWGKNKHEKLTRHPNKELGCEPGDCEFAVIYEDGEYKRLNYIETRKKLYIPAYAKLFVKTETYKYLKKLVDEGKKIALLDYDAYNYYNQDYKDGLYKGVNCIKDVINNPKLKGGHAFVIKMLLEGDIEVVDGEIIDKMSLLD